MRNKSTRPVLYERLKQLDATREKYVSMTSTQRGCIGNFPSSLTGQLMGFLAGQADNGQREIIERYSDNPFVARAIANPDKRFISSELERLEQDYAEGFGSWIPKGGNWPYSQRVGQMAELVGPEVGCLDKGGFFREGAKPALMFPFLTAGLFSLIGGIESYLGTNDFSTAQNLILSGSLSGIATFLANNDSSIRNALRENANYLDHKIEGLFGDSE